MATKQIAQVGEFRALASLKANPLNPRTPGADDPGMAELVESIRSVGLLQPLLVTPDGLIVAGHRRAIAAKRAGLTEVPVIVRQMDESAQLSAMLIENIHRQSLNLIQVARSLRGLRDRGITPEEITRRTGISHNSVKKHLAAAMLPEVLQEKIADFSMALGMAEPLCKLPSSDKQIMLGMRAVREGWNIMQLTAAVGAELNLKSGGHIGPVPGIARPSAPTAPRPIEQHVPMRTPRSETALGAPARTLGSVETIELLTDLTTAFRRQPGLAHHAMVWEWAERLVIAMRDARRSAA